ncbi:hypothetical protein DXG03_004578 [Asterophora parasitica]|uniref:HTH APSES-type domain-containing protein n=1 Tax=Asterophora parasitica TaxID=117018 RepID=A0A9P7KBA4_9AGAR|nr:hypothetical protein DXG03_004578 [Asterophora parasitica]
MIDSQPDLAPLIRRVRGGYLKIQGTWMPYEVALRLSRRVAWTIRDDLVPLFGPTFPSTCLSPDQPGYGQVVASGPNRRRARRTQAAATVQPLLEAHTSWTVVTPSDSNTCRTPHVPPQYLHTAFYPPNRDASLYQQQKQQQQHHSSAPHRGGHDSPDSPGSPASTSRGAVRYSPYSANAPHPHPVRRSSTDARSQLSLDIPSLSLRDSIHHSRHRTQDQDQEMITLPPIQAPADPSQPRAPYALPPISALEDLRGIHANDSAAVLRRLKSDDLHPISDRDVDVDAWRRRSFSSQSHRSAEDARPQTEAASRSYPDHSYRSSTPSESDSEFSSLPRSLPHSHSHSHSRTALSLSVPSDGFSTCDPSPVSPATPRSVTSNSNSHSNSGHTGKEYPQREPYYPMPMVATHAGEWLVNRQPEADARMGPRRHSDADNETHPHRPW